MKTIGMIGGMSWESSLEYYRLMNEEVKHRLGGLHSAELVMYSVDFAPLEELQRAADWPSMDRLMAEAAVRLERAGAGCVVLATNTMHKCFPAMQAAVKIPLLHIADAAGAAITAAGLQRVGLLGTRFTMEQDFYSGRLSQQHGLDVLIPDPAGRNEVHRIIYEELVLGIIKEESRQTYRQVIAELVERGAQGIILGCTEIGLLVSAADSAVPLFDTTRLHAKAAVDWALDGV